MSENQSGTSRVAPEQVDALLARLRPGLKLQKPAENASPLRRFDPVKDQNYRLQIDDLGVFDSLTCHVCPRVAPKPKEIEVEVHAAALNFRDVMIALNLYPHPPGEKPTLGSDFAGRVARVGPDVTEFKVGDEVAGIAEYSFAGYTVAKTEDVIHKPTNLSFEEAATIPVVFYTVYLGLKTLADLWPGESVLIHSAAGGVGLAAIQFANWVGAEIFATAGTPEKRELLRSLGVKHVMDSRTLAWADEIRAATGGKGVDVVLNSLPGDGMKKGLELLRPLGRFVEIGRRDIMEDRQIGLGYFADGASFFSIDFDVMSRHGAGDRMRKELTTLFSDGTFKPLQRKAFSITEAPKAFQCLSAGTHIGKVALLMKDRPVMVHPELARA